METLEIVRKSKRTGKTLISLLMSHIMQGQQCFRGDEDAYLRVSHPRTMSKCADCNLANSQGKKLTVASGKFPTLRSPLLLIEKVGGKTLLPGNSVVKLISGK